MSNYHFWLGADGDRDINTSFRALMADAMERVALEEYDKQANANASFSQGLRAIVARLGYALGAALEASKPHDE